MQANQFAELWFKLSREMKAYMEEALAPTLTESQLTVLEYLFSHDQVKPSDLIDYLATTPAAVTTLLDRMEKNGLVVRKRDARDRRIVWIRLTEKGKQEGERGLRIREQCMNRLLGRISAHNQRLLIYLLGKVSAGTSKD
jgi:DNA-binding MarR family transcriptional regulator